VKFVVEAFVATRVVKVPFDPVILFTVVVPNVVTPVTLSVPLELSDEVAVMSPPIIVPAVSALKKAVAAFTSVEKKLVAVSAVAVVVASVEVPRTIRRPDVVALPFESTAKLEFAVHVMPFQ
jgi:hypothetical protein